MKRFELSKEIRGLEFFFLAFVSYFAIRGEPIRGSMIATYVLCLLGWDFVLFETYRIEISTDNTIHFKKLVRTISIRPEDLVAITDHLKYDVIQYKRGQVHLSPFIGNLSELKSALKALNSDIKFEEDFT